MSRASKTSRGRRGKYTEDRVNDYLKKVDRELVNFDFQKVSDARSAGGRGGKAVVGDFEFFSPTSVGVVECKEIDHDFRIPAANITQLPRARKRMLAGSQYWFVFYHSSSKKWRRVCASELETRSTGSWNLEEKPTYDSVEEALPITLFGGAA